MDLYYSPTSGPSRTVLMAAAAVGVTFNKKIINTMQQDQLKPEYLKINPQHTIPTLVDDGFTLWESRAIMVYLVEKYGKDDSLYPKDPQKQALINQRLQFDMGVLYKSFSDYYYVQFRFNKPADPELYKKVEIAFDFLNTFLEGQQYVAGNQLTVADICTLSSVSTFELVGFKIENYPNVARWYENAKKVTPGWEENKKHLQVLADRFESLRKERSA